MESMCSHVRTSPGRSASCLCWSSAWRRDPCGFVESFNWCECVPMLRDACHRGVLVLVTRRY